MNLIKEIKTRYLLFLFLLPLLTVNPIFAEETFLDIQWETGDTKIKFNSKDSSFHQENLFDISISDGIFSISDQTVHLKNHDHTIHASFNIEYKNKVLVLKKGSETLKLKPSEAYPTSFSFTSILRGLLGMIVLILLGFLMSSKRKSIDWVQIGKGVGLQIILAILLIQVPFIESAFDWLSSKFVTVVNFSQEGGKFIFASFGTGVIESPMINFAVMVVPTIIFFSALTSLLYFWGILQYVVKGFAWVMKKTLKLSGAESMAAAGNIFLGQTEAPLLVRPFLDKMTKSELFCLMVGGMATIAGGVLAAYMQYLGGGDKNQELFFAKHLLIASIISAPAAIVFAKLLIPETEKIDSKLEIPKNKLGSNALDAISTGTTDGIKLAVNVVGMLIVFISLMAMANYLLGGIGKYTGLNQIIAENTQYNDLNFQFIIGYTLSPLAWLMGVPDADIFKVAQLLGEKTIMNEFMAYKSLGQIKESMTPKGIIMATYVLCGFANFASIGIQIGGIGALVPKRRGELAKVGFKALIAGTLACLMTAVIVGMFY
jgi:CNT family concentrative nucleoside transporter